MLLLKNIHKTYHAGSPLHVLKGINLEIEKGEFVSIMGASGSGKSTLLNIMGILDDYDEGEYYLDGRLIRGLNETQAAAARNRMIGFIFQSFNLINYKNAMENVALPLYYQGVPRRKRNAVALELLDKLGIREWGTLADEPTGALDSKTSQEVMDLLRQVNDEGMTIVCVTHERDIAQRTDKIIYLRDGIIESITDTGR